MQNEIPSGTKVFVVSTSKGKTVRRTAEVLSHMDGVVHVDLDGEAVSVTPDQIELTGEPSSADLDAQAAEQSAATATNKANSRKP